MPDYIKRIKLFAIITVCVLELTFATCLLTIAPSTARSGGATAVSINCVDNGGAKVNPANEGKLVLIHGSMDVINNASDSNYDMEFKYPLVVRDKENYEYITYDDNTEPGYDWVLFKSTPLAGVVKIGEFEIDRKLLGELDVPGNYVLMTEYEHDGWEIPKNGNERYLVKDKSRLSYKAFQPKVGEKFTFIGIQMGSTLKYCENSVAVSGVKAVEELIIEDDGRGDRIRTAVYSLVAMMEFTNFAYAICLIIPKKPKPEPSKNSKPAKQKEKSLLTKKMGM